MPSKSPLASFAAALAMSVSALDGAISSRFPLFAVKDLMRRQARARMSVSSLKRFEFGSPPKFVALAVQGGTGDQGFHLCRSMKCGTGVILQNAAFGGKSPCRFTNYGATRLRCAKTRRVERRYSASGKAAPSSGGLV